MRPKKQGDGGQKDLFRIRLDEMINMQHALVKLAGLIDWDRLHNTFAPYYKEHGRPGVPIQMILGLHFLKHIYGLSDEEVCARWVDNPYFQYFCGESFFQFNFPMERSSLSHFRNRIDPQELEKVLQESLHAAFKGGSLRLKDLKKVVVDTTVQEKAIAHPTAHGLFLKAIEKVGTVAKQVGIKLRQSYVRVAKNAAIKVGRYIHAKQMKRARKSLKYMKVRLGRLIRDVRRKSETLCETAQKKLQNVIKKAKKIHQQQRGDKGYLYAWHAPEVECISKGKARTPYEFGCKVSFATQLKASGGGKHYVLGAKAFHGAPYDGHTLKDALDQIETIVGKCPGRSYVDKGYRGHKLKGKGQIIISGQKRGVTPNIKREMKRRSVIEPIIGHAKNDGLLGRNYLKGQRGDQMNAILSAVGFNFRQLLAYLHETAAA